ncbi:MAG TPA: hypothetical protein VM223_03830 [Planctomycetota bacterium]|nr:hypothetical protein [Planctomycetota bacterium]
MTTDPPIWLMQWQARGGPAFMTYEQFTAPKRRALAEGRLKLVRPARARVQQPEFIAHRETICRACEHFDRSIEHPCHCRLIPPGTSRCYKRRPTSACPADPPRWGPVKP